MKLSKLYSNKPFHNVTFITNKGGFNVVLGDVKGKTSEDQQHNLGKSKLGELLDFMLLKDHKELFFYKTGSKQKFLGYEFYLEIELNSGEYLTIKRTVDTPTKISFKQQHKKSEGYILYEDFDKELAFDKAKNYLNEQLNFDFCKTTTESYRRLVNYSLRTQGDYEPKMNTIFQLRKFTKNKDKDWKPLLFNLLGFDGEILRKKYDLEEQIKEENDRIKVQEKDFDIKAENKDLLVGKIQNAESERADLVRQLGSFDFYQQDKNTIQHLVGDIENNIADLNQQLYIIEYDINKLEKSIRNDFSFDLEKIKILFEEVQIHFPKNLAHSYEQLIDFNHQITQERHKQIRETLQKKKVLQQEINKKLIDLNHARAEHKDVIQDTSFFKKNTTYQKQIIEIERDLSRFQTQLEAIEAIEKKKESVKEKQKNELEDVKQALKDILDNTATCLLYMSIRKTFLDIVKRILNETAIITLKLKNTYNVDFKPEFIDSAKDEGATYYKILCVAFDLAILINYRNKSHFRFVYHDDVVSGDDNGVKSRLIEVIRGICLQHDIQYIFSVIKDNIPPGQNLQHDVILSLNDREDSGKLFKMSF